MNLHFYLSPISAHPLGTHKGIIISIVEKFYKHCSEISNYEPEVHKFYQRLLNVGYSPEFLTKSFEEAEQRLK